MAKRMKDKPLQYRVTIRPDQLQSLRKLSAETMRPPYEIAQEAIDEYIDRHKIKKGR